MSARSSEKNTRFFRLDPAVQAPDIELAFDLDPNSDRFSGEATYSLDIGRRKQKLILHSNELDVSHVRLKTARESFAGCVEERPQSETIALSFDRPLPKGRAELKLVFRGRVRNDLRGLYAGGSRVDEGGDGDKSSMGSRVAARGNEAWIASQLCPTDARRFFPCFDEPGFKARYRIRVRVPQGTEVLSNAPVESESMPCQGLRQVQFATTPPLSSYLVAVAAGPFESSRVRRVGTTDIRILTLPGKQSLAAFALEAAEECLVRLERWFGMPHPYPKLDLLALPDFAFGAMENAGAVFFRDSILLLNAREASLDEKKRAAEVIAHEISHMWFGNLVTMAWWNDLWLNEAFATWMAYLIVDDWKPEWSIWLDFAHRREEALNADALTSTHAIAPAIRSAEEAHENFDAITYTKGAAVLRMLEQYLGPRVFQKGVRDYIETHREGNAEASDLWRALGQASGEDVERLVGPWTLREGFPLVSIRRSKGALRLAQERFRNDAERTARTPAERWTIPWVGRGVAAGRRKPQAIRRLWKTLRVSLEEDESDGFYGNAQESGFFRTAHSTELEEALLQRIDRLDAAERIGFLGSQWALVRAGRRDIARPLDLVAVLGNDPAADVLAMVERILGGISARLLPAQRPDRSDAFEAFVARHFAPAFAEVGFDASADLPSDGATDLRRARLVSILGGFAKDEAILAECERRCAALFEDRRALPGEIAGEILRLAAFRGDERLHSELRAATRRAHSPQSRRRSLLALAAFRDPDLSHRSFDAALDPALAPVSDRAQLIQQLLAKRDSAPRSWERLQRDWPRLEKEMPPILLARLARTTAVALPASEGPEIRAFFREHPLAAGDRVLKEISEELRLARGLEKRAGPALDHYLARDLTPQRP